MSSILFLFLMFGGSAFAQDDAAPETEATEEAATEEADAPEAEEPKADAEKPKADAEEAEEPKAKAKALPGVEVPSTDAEALKDVQEAVNAVQTGQWATFGVLLIGLLLFGWNRFTSMKAEKAADEAKPTVDADADAK